MTLHSGVEATRARLSSGRPALRACVRLPVQTSTLAYCAPWQVLGVELLRTKVVSETHALVIRHLAHIRDMAGFEDSTAVLCLESNLGYECQHIAQALQRAEVPRWVALNEGAGGTIGCNNQPNQGADDDDDARALRVGCITLVDGFFSTTLGEEEAKEKLRDELGRFSVVGATKHAFWQAPAHLHRQAGSPKRRSRDRIPAVYHRD